MGLLRRMLRIKDQKIDDGIYLYFKLDVSGEIVRIRLNPGSDLMVDYQTSDRFIRKTIIGPRSYRRAEAELTFNDRFKLVEWEIDGAELTTEEEYLAQQAALPD